VSVSKIYKCHNGSLVIMSEGIKSGWRCNSWKETLDVSEQYVLFGWSKKSETKKNRERVNTLPQNITEPMSIWFLCCLPQQAEIFLFMKYSIIVQQQNPITPTISYSSMSFGGG